jgi:uncharacterized RDD family membrane protein YckC
VGAPGGPRRRSERRRVSTGPPEAVGHDVGVTTTAPHGAPDPTAVVGRRFLAVAIDLGILWVFSATFWLLASRERPGSSNLDNGACTGQSFCTNFNDRYVAGWPLAILVVVWLAYMVGVFVFQRGLTGRTVGTMLTGVAVVGSDGRPLGPAKALLRSVAGVVDYLPCCLPLVGVVTVLASPGHRRVGDMAAESYVVGNHWFGRPVELPGPPAPPAPAAIPPDGYPAQPPIPAGPRPPFAPGPPPGVAPAYTAAPASAPGAVAQGPVWDPERRAYLQWDPAREQWLQFEQATQTWQQYDAASGRWRPVDR